MLKIAQMSHRYKVDSDRGANLVEYAFLVGLIALVCIVAVTFFGGGVSHNMSSNASAVGNAG
jgi:pilus assembly protein Flp/PilA